MIEQTHILSVGIVLTEADHSAAKIQEASFDVINIISTLHPLLSNTRNTLHSFR